MTLPNRPANPAFPPTPVLLPLHDGQLSTGRMPGKQRMAADFSFRCFRRPRGPQSTGNAPHA
ncbi:hypothetical protein MUU72_04685 [Streptomyces sp. RS10V-4]|uniref:hypothetical protein n=1 Tax=Streptomyces rhizoryzae TaxID=2932493 RepID=UPI002002EA94|nr:hypothetical protein [Streptomyces rhizoryzae]MCK7622418.1 hypothetical protein [Streptomyces rhizoryzae]